MAIRYTQAERTGYVDAFKASGLSLKQFFAKHKILALSHLTIGFV
jgi:hypothetical protein